jgi:hypothetical protein
VAAGGNGGRGGPWDQPGGVEDPSAGPIGKDATQRRTPDDGQGAVERRAPKGLGVQEQSRLQKARCEARRALVAIELANRDI